MTIEEIKNQVAQENGFASFDTAMVVLCSPKGSYHNFHNLINIAMHRIAEITCKEQRQICCAKFIMSDRDTEKEMEAIENAPISSDQYKPY